jgi:enoyl-CoA hydratase/carnithine racemase
VVPREHLWARADEIASLIARKPPVAVQGSVRAIWEALDMPRSTAMMNALKYTQLGNPIGAAQVERGSVPKTQWTLR